MSKPCILICDNDDFCLRSLRKELEAGGFCVITCDADGEVCLEQIEKHRPNAVLFSLFLKHFNVFEVKKRYDEAFTHTTETLFFASGYFCDKDVEIQLATQKFKYYFIKPYDVRILTQQLRYYLNFTEKSPEPNKIETLLLRLCIPAKLNGFAYANYAIELIVSDQTYLKQATKRLYPQIAKKFDTTSSAVEKSLRFAIDTAFKYTKPDLLESFFPAYCSCTQKVTTLNFLSSLADKLDKTQNYSSNF